MDDVRQTHLLIVGCGDVGLRTAQALKAQTPEIRITGLRRRPPTLDASATAKAIDAWIAADVTQPDTLIGIGQDVTHVLFTLTPASRSEAGYRQTYLEGLQHVMDVVSSDALERVVYVSSSAVYGDHQGAWIDEETQEAPGGFNGAVLLEAERWLHQQGFSSTALRLAGIYGPGRTQLLDRIASGEAKAPSTPPHWANRIHVDDAAEAGAVLLRAPRVARTYLGADDTPLPLHTLYSALADMLGCAPPAEGPAPANVGSKRLSNARLKSLGWQARHPDARQGYRTLI